MTIHVTTTFFALEVPFGTMKAKDQSFSGKKSRRLKMNNSKETTAQSKEKTELSLRVLILSR